MFIDNSCKLHGTCHDHPVGGNGAENIIHCGDSLYHAWIIDCTWQVKKYEIQRSARIGKPTRCIRRVVRFATHYRIGFLRKAFELLVSHHLVIIVFHRHVHVAFTHVMDTVLWKVAINHSNVIPLNIVQITCNQHRDSCFSSSSLLRGESYINRLFHKSIILLVIQSIERSCSYTIAWLSYQQTNPSVNYTAYCLIYRHCS